MMKNYLLSFILLFTATNKLISQNKSYSKDKIMSEKKIIKSDKEWKEILSEEEFHILRNKRLLKLIFLEISLSIVSS